MRVHIREDFGSMRLDVYVVRDLDGDRSMLLGHTEDGLETWTEYDQRFVADPASPSFSVPHQAAHALLGALARHLGAVEHPEQLRKDYMAERTRVDLLIGALIKGTGRW